MDNSSRITPRQLYRLLVLLVLPTALLSIPTVTLKQAGNGGWLSPFFSSLIGTAVFLVVYRLYKAFPNETLASYATRIIGVLGGKILAAIYGIFFWTSGVLVVHEMMGLIKSAILMKTPIIAIYLCIYLSLAFMLVCGLEALARISDLIFFFPFLLIPILVTAGIGTFHNNAFLPFLNKGWLAVLRGAVVPSSWFGEVVLAAMLLPLVHHPQRIVRFGVRGIGVTALLLMIVIAIVVNVMGFEEGSREIYPTFQVIRYLQWGDFFQHVDMLFLIPWLSQMVVKALVLCYAGLASFTDGFRLQGYKILIAPLVAFSIVGDLWFFPDEVSFRDFLYAVYPIYALFLELILPCLLLVIYWARRKSLARGASA